MSGPSRQAIDATYHPKGSVSIYPFGKKMRLGRVDLEFAKNQEEELDNFLGGGSSMLII